MESLDRLLSGTWQWADCQFVNPDVGWAIGTAGHLYGTRDGGNSWRQKAVGNPNLDFVALFFTDDKTAWVAQNSGASIYRSNDGGETWTPQSMPFSDFSVTSVHFINSEIGWAAGTRVLHSGQDNLKREGIVLRTADGGRTWVPQHASDTEWIFRVVYFADKLHGWLVSPLNVYCSQDGGQTWVLSLRTDAE
jgi:photosystem II stability/assembly factor-like uncharacterized protein